MSGSTVPLGARTGQRTLNYDVNGGNNNDYDNAGAL